MKKSRVLTLGLACFFTAVTAFSAVAATSGGGRLLSNLNDNSHAQNASTQQFSQPDEKATHDAAILSGEGLGLDPENDPVLGITESGLEIKYHGANLSSGSLSGYAYVTMASRNWVIIGQSSSGLGNKFPIHTYKNNLATSSFVEQSTVAGKAIWADTNFLLKTSINSGIPGTVISIPNAVSSSELEADCVLVISEKNIADSSFTSLGSETDYANSTYCTLQQTISGYCKNTNGTMSSTIGFTQSQMALIQPQTIKTAYNVSNVTHQSSMTAYLFPLASAYRDSGAKYTTTEYATQNFLIETYLNTDAKRISYTAGTTTADDYWLRTHFYYMSSSWHQGVSSTGSIYIWTSTSGVRPAFVLKLA